MSDRASVTWVLGWLAAMCLMGAAIFSTTDRAQAQPAPVRIKCYDINVAVSEWTDWGDKFIQNRRVNGTICERIQ